MQPSEMKRKDFAKVFTEFVQVSVAADRTARRAALRPSCCTQTDDRRQFITQSVYPKC